MLYDDIIIQVAKRPIVKGELDLHEQLLFAWNETHSVDAAR